MAKKRAVKTGMQWKVLKGVMLEELERTCEEWTGKGWTVFTILGPMSGGLVVVCHRLLVL